MSDQESPDSESPGMQSQDDASDDTESEHTESEHTESEHAGSDDSGPHDSGQGDGALAVVSGGPEQAAPAPEPAAVLARSGGPLAIPLTAPAVTLTALVTMLFLMFLLIEPTPRWVALFGSAVVALAMDGVLRGARRLPFQSGADTTPYLFLPALFVLAIPVFLEHNVRGYWAAPAAIGAGLTFGAVALAQVASVREFDPARGLARFVATAATYFVAFAIYSLTYRFELALSAAMLATALGTALLAIEILREGEVDPLETLVFAVVTALIVAEVRWTLHFVPLDGYLAGLTMLITFYFVTGVLHSHITRHLTPPVAAEYVAIASAGVTLVVVARAAGLA